MKLYGAYLSSSDWLISLSIILSGSIRVVTIGNFFFFFYGRRVVYYVNVPQLSCSLVYCWALELLSNLGCCKKCSKEHRGAYRVGESGFTVVSMQNIDFILVLLFLNYCNTYLYYSCKPSFAHPWIFFWSSVLGFFGYVTRSRITRS